MTARAQYYNSTAREFLTKAREHLAEGDLLQASEKGWGAAAQAVEAVCEVRGWLHSGHGHLFTAIDGMAAETGDEEIRTAFGLAGTLHTNFYEGWLSRETVEAYLSRVAELVEKLEPLAV